MMLQKKIMEERMSNTGLREEMSPDPASELYLAPSTIDELSEPFGNSVNQMRQVP